MGLIGQSGACGWQQGLAMDQRSTTIYEPRGMDLPFPRPVSKQLNALHVIQSSTNFAFACL